MIIPHVFHIVAIRDQKQNLPFESLLLVCAVQVCELGVMNTPCSSTALCMLGLAQLAQSDSDAGSETGQAALADACLSFQASITLEGSPLTGEPPEQLTSKLGLPSFRENFV